MQKYFIIVLFFLGINTINSQELNCKVTVNSSQISGSNKQVFTTLEKSISEFINNTKWTNKSFKKQEKIQCVIILNIAEQNGSNKFKGDIQIQAIRPVYNSTYQTSTLNYKDEDMEFVYEEFQPLIYNESSYESNLTSLLSFYAYIILGFDQDSFALNGGDKYFKKAEQIMLTAQQGGHKGWNSLDGNKSRFQLIDNILNKAYQNFRRMMYNYHFKGLDYMHKDQTRSKQAIANAIISLKSIYSRRPSSFLLRIFVDTKSDEIETIFKDGPKIDTRNLKDMLMRVYPSLNTNWKNID